MQNKIINIDDIAAEIAEMVKSETEDTKKAADEAAKKAITKARDELKATSPRRTGKYARGWKTRKAEKFYEKPTKKSQLPEPNKQQRCYNSVRFDKPHYIEHKSLID